MDESGQEDIIRAIDLMNEDLSALNFIESAKESDPLQFFLLLSQIVIDEQVTIRIASNCIVLMSSILRPTIDRPLNVLKSEFQAIDPASIDSIKQSFFRCLTFPDQIVRLNAARCIGFFAKIEFPRKKWHDVFEQLKMLADDTESYGEWSPIGAISSMREIITEARIWPRWTLFQQASNVIFNTCFTVMSKDIDPDLKIEVVNCLEIAVPIFVNVDTIDTQFYQKMLDIIITHIQIENYQLHQQLFSLLTVFLIQIYKILDDEIVSQIFNSLIGDLTSNDDIRQYHVIRLCRKIAKFELEYYCGDYSESQMVITELLEQNFDEIFLKIIANGDFSDLDEAESPWITQHEALNCLYDFGKVSSEQLFQDCVEFYETYFTSDNSSIQLSALCAAQVITSIQTEDAIAFIESNLEPILDLCGSEDPLIRCSAFSILKSSLLDKKEVLCTDEHFDTVLQIIKFGLESDINTAKKALDVFKSLCGRFDDDDYFNDPFLGENFPLIMEMLLSAQEREDAFECQFIEFVSDAIFMYIQQLPKIGMCKDELIELLKKTMAHFTESSSSGADERTKSSDLLIVVGIVQALEDLVIPFGQMLLTTLLQELSNNNGNENDIITVITQIIFFIGQEAEPFLDQLFEIAEEGQMSNSPAEVNRTAELIGVIVAKVESSHFVNDQFGNSIVQRLFQLVYSNLEKVETLLSSIPSLLFALADIIKGVAADNPENPENARAFVSPLMDLCSVYVKNLEYYVNSDFDAANAIADALMNAFIIIIETFPTENEFISENLKPIFIQVPIIVWNHKMLTKRTVKYFLLLMLLLIRSCGRQNNVELNNANLRNFLNFANDMSSPYKDLIPLADTVRKFYSDI